VTVKNGKLWLYTWLYGYRPESVSAAYAAIMRRYELRLYMYLQPFAIGLASLNISVTAGLITINP